MEVTASFYTPDKASIERLRVILTERSGTEVSLEEAEEVGVQFVSLYECLARERGLAKEHCDGSPN